MSSFTIKDLENLSGIKAHTIRVWEQRYSFLKPATVGYQYPLLFQRGTAENSERSPAE
jgi:hypothetical protein